MAPLPGFVVVLATAATLSACYRPSHEAACETSCSGSDDRCPNEMSCGLDLRCHATGAPDCSDAAPPPCFGTKIVDFDAICDPLGLAPELPISGLINTDVSCNEHPQKDGSTVCVLIATDVNVSAATRVIGARPLAVIATHDLTITDTGSIDAGSHRTDFSLGAGRIACPMAALYDGTASDSGGGGGAGGAFQGAGGAGGSGGVSPIAPGSIPMPPLPIPRVLHGGCDSGMGGGSPGTPTNNQGKGGGALYLIAGHKLTIAGAVAANGGGGSPGVGSQGGGGGGAGGMIVLEAPTVSVTGSVTANGGGGAGGSGSSSASPGADGDASSSNAGAPGGMSTNNGGMGGHGSTRMSFGGGNGQNQLSSANGAGGGGGGGGAGLIMVFARTLDADAAMFSPTFAM